MTTFVDSSVLIPLLQPDSKHHDWCREQYEAASMNGPVVVSDIVYAEFTIGMSDKESADLALTRFALSRCGYSDDALFRAGRAFLSYKRTDGQRDSLLPDFLIGALAEAEGKPLLTRDPAKVRTYFPSVELVTPNPEARAQ